LGENYGTSCYFVETKINRISYVFVIFTQSFLVVSKKIPLVSSGFEKGPPSLYFNIVRHFFVPSHPSAFCFRRLQLTVLYETCSVFSDNKWHRRRYTWTHYQDNITTVAKLPSPHFAVHFPQQQHVKQIINRCSQCFSVRHLCLSQFTSTTSEASKTTMQSRLYTVTNAF
jgi:hypothetical protein